MTTRKPTDLPARPGTPTIEKTVVTFRFPADLGHWLQDEAERRGWSMNELMVTIARTTSGRGSACRRSRWREQLDG